MNNTSIFSVIKVSFAIIGTVIGAGFISGREILTFFSNQSIIFSVIILFVIFSLGFYLLLTVKNLQSYGVLKIFEPLVLFGNLIILSSMVSVIDDIVFNVFNISKNAPFFSIITLILSNFIISNGIENLKLANTILVPIIIVFTIFILLYKNTFYISANFKFNILFIFLYVGVNTFTSSTVFIDLGYNLNKREALLASVLASLILSFFIFLIYSSLINLGDEIVHSSTPMLEYLKNNKNFNLLFSILMYFGVVTTLFSSHYPLLKFCENFQNKKIAKTILIIIAFAISRLGFYNIINYLYPILGGIGVIYLIIISILSRFSR